MNFERKRARENVEQSHHNPQLTTTMPPPLDGCPIAGPESAQVSSLDLRYPHQVRQSGVHGLNTTGEALQTFSLHLLKTWGKTSSSTHVRRSRRTLCGYHKSRDLTWRIRDPQWGTRPGSRALWLSPDSRGDKSGIGCHQLGWPHISRRSPVGRCGNSRLLIHNPLHTQTLKDLA